MKRLKGMMFVATVAIVLCLMSTVVWAGSKQQHRWEGIAIGAGAVVLGQALIGSHVHADRSGPPVAFSYHYREYPSPSRHHPGPPTGFCSTADRYHHRNGHLPRWNSPRGGHHDGWHPRPSHHQRHGDCRPDCRDR